MPQIIIEEDQMERFLKIRKDLFAFIDWKRKAGFAWKMVEGRFSISYDYPIRDDDPAANADPVVTITVNCYLIGPGSIYSWQGATFGDALDKAERELREMMEEEYNEV